MDGLCEDTCIFAFDDEGGNAGTLDAVAEGQIVLGDISAVGGRSLTGAGGDGGGLTLNSTEGSLQVVGAMDVSGGDADGLGKGYVALYTMLWDEDESMMQQRQAELDRSARVNEATSPRWRARMQAIQRPCIMTLTM